MKYLVWIFLSIEVVSILLPYIEMKEQDILSLPFYLLVSLLGFFMILKINEFRNLKEGIIKKFLIYCGNNTLTILTFHFVVFKIVSYLICFVYSLLFRVAEFPQMRCYSDAGWWIVYSLIGIGIPLIFRYLTVIIHEYINSKSASFQSW